MTNDRINRKQIENDADSSASEPGRFPDLDSDEPKRSPIRRRHKLPNDDFNPKTRRNDKKKHNRQKYEY
jgi:hypothetical protein